VSSFTENKGARDKPFKQTKLTASPLEPATPEKIKEVKEESKPNVVT
jgi:hypothetical protein